jgi:peroxiredoxin
MASSALAGLGVTLWLAGCGTPSPLPDASSAADLTGEWRSVLASPGGELPFTLRISDGDSGLTAVALNHTEEVPFSAVEIADGVVTLAIDWYDAELSGRLSADGTRIDGRWRKTIPDGDAELDWTAERGNTERFRLLAAGGLATGAAAVVPEISGTWKVLFTSDDGSREEARGELLQQGALVTGTFLTPTGDYRYLEGSYESGALRLSTFDGAHVFLFHARAEDDGSLSGDFWSRDSYHASWTAERVDDDSSVLPDPWQQVQPTRPDRRFHFSFPDLDGQMVTSEEQRFTGKVLIVVLFGSWCPNCNDEVPVLADWYRRWSSQGLEIVGLAFEFSGESERDRRVLRRYRERHGISFPLLLAGVSDKTAAAQAVPDLSAVLSYPTTVLIGRDGTVRWIHSGFSGPGTGRHHQELLTVFESRIRTLLAEPAG